jgi:hypothetical protein
MSRLLFVVQEAFEFKGRGIVMVPGIVAQDSEVFRPGDSLLLKQPGGSVVEAKIGSLELPSPNPRHEVCVLVKELTRAEVPIGTEVWSA